jgi:hypothetical protein
MAHRGFPPWVEGEDELIGFWNPERLGGRWGDRQAQRQPVTDALWACLVGQRGKKKIVQYPSHRILGRMHRVLNVGKKINNCTVCL